MADWTSPEMGKIMSFEAALDRVPRDSSCGPF